MEEEVSYVELSIIGEGSYGVVYEGNIVNDGDIKGKVAIKRPRLDVSANFTVCLKEIDIMSSLSYHPHITELISIDIDDSQNLYDPVKMIMPLAAYSLDTYIKDYEYEEDNIMSIITQITLGVKHMHDNNIIHRDLRPSNILVYDPEGRIVVTISDFGMSIRDCGERHTPNTSVYCYKAPELCGGNYDCSVDIWSLGCICYELCKKQHIFMAKNNEEWKAKYKSLELDMKGIPKLLKKFILSCLTNSDKRATADQLLDILSDTEFSSYIKSLRIPVEKETTTINAINTKVLQSFIDMKKIYSQVDVRILSLAVDISFRLVITDPNPKAYAVFLLYLAYKYYITLNTPKSFKLFAAGELDSREISYINKNGLDFEISILHVLGCKIYRTSIYEMSMRKGKEITINTYLEIVSKITKNGKVGSPIADYL